MAEMSFGARRHTAVRKAEEDSTPTFNIQALLQGCVATRPDDSSDQTPLIVDFPDRPAKMLAAVLSDYGPAKRLKVQMCDLPRLPHADLGKCIENIDQCRALLQKDWANQKRQTTTNAAQILIPVALFLMLYFQVRKCGLATWTPVNNIVALINQTFFI